MLIKRILAVGSVVAVASGLCPSSATSATSRCQYLAAHYVLLGHPDVTARFVSHPKFPDIIGDVFFHIHFDGRGWDFWYMFDAGSGYSTVRLVSIEDPTKKNWQPPDPDGGPHRPNPDENYFGIDSNLAVRDEIPFGKNAAPAYIFVPDFGMHVWYRPETVNSARRYSVPRAFFRLDRCAR